LSEALDAEGYLLKAERALVSARTLLDDADVEGACNRAYYAMFDAAHAALLGLGAVPDGQSPKTHRGLIGAFGKHLVLGGMFDGELGASLNRVEKLRTLADYTGDPISAGDAASAILNAETFLQAVRAKLG
jgi:uncharacterized protein (UPF0332 family)